jgi:hypothetical protein
MKMSANLSAEVVIQMQHRLLAAFESASLIFMNKYRAREKVSCLYGISKLFKIDTHYTFECQFAAAADFPARWNVSVNFFVIKG